MDVKFTPRKRSIGGDKQDEIMQNMHLVNSLPLILKTTRGTIIQPDGGY